MTHSRAMLISRDPNAIMIPYASRYDIILYQQVLSDPTSRRRYDQTGYSGRQQHQQQQQQQQEYNPFQNQQQQQQGGHGFNQQSWQEWFNSGFGQRTHNHNRQQRQQQQHARYHHLLQNPIFRAQVAVPIYPVSE